MSQDDEYEYEERAPSPLDRKSTLDRSQKLPPSVKKTQSKAVQDDMDVDGEEEDLPPPRLVQQKQLSRAPSPIFESDMKRTRASSSRPPAKSKAKPQSPPTRNTRNTRSSKLQDPEPTSEDSMPSDSSSPAPPRRVGPAPKKKR